MCVTTVGRLMVPVLMSACLGAVLCHSQAPPTIESELTKYKIQITPTSLRAALKDNRAKIRGMAASELGSMRNAASVAPIMKALIAERDPEARFDMASALVLLDSKVGNKALTQVCDDTSLPGERRLQAASRLVDAGDLSCLSSVTNVLGDTADPSNKISALLILKRTRAVPASIAPEIQRTLLASLRDRAPSVRQFAADCIAALDGNAAVPALEGAISAEADDTTRAHMEDLLRVLRGGRPSH
jgi:HEAT repeat protein